MKIKIALLFWLLIAIAFSVNWKVATQTIRGEKIEDVEKVLHHLLVESIDEYIVQPPLPVSDISFLYKIPHNLLVLNDSEASHVRFIVTRTPHTPMLHEVSFSVQMENGFYLNAVSDEEKIDAAVAKYAQKLLERYLYSLIVILIISYVLLQRYMRPLGVLAERARGWKNGDSFEFSLDNPGQEIDEVSRAFSALVSRLEGFRAKEKGLFKEMAHELKTPIALMRARLDVYEGSDHISKEKFVSEIGHDIGRLTSELKNVLFFESSDFEDLSIFDTAEILNEVIEKVAILTERRRLEIMLSPERFILRSQRKLFKKVMTALIENALTYAKEKSSIAISINERARTLSISNKKGDEKYLFSSKIGQKMLNRVSEELCFNYEIIEDETEYRIELQF